MKRIASLTGTIIVVLATAVFAIGIVRASDPVRLDVTADDLAATGVTGVMEVVPDSDRFKLPVKYFRSPEKLSETDAKKDCADCGDLIAVYAAETSGIPGWNAEKILQFVKVGGRLQLRTYIPSHKRIVTVTAVSEQTMRKISKYLVEKFSK